MHAKLLYSDEDLSVVDTSARHPLPEQHPSPARSLVVTVPEENDSWAMRRHDLRQALLEFEIRGTKLKAGYRFENDPQGDAKIRSLVRAMEIILAEKGFLQVIYSRGSHAL